MVIISIKSTVLVVFGTQLMYFCLIVYIYIELYYFLGVIDRPGACSCLGNMWSSVEFI